MFAKIGSVFTTIAIWLIAICAVFLAGHYINQYVGLGQIWDVLKVVLYWFGFVFSIVLFFICFMNFQRGIVFEQLLNLEIIQFDNVIGETPIINKVKAKIWGNLIGFLLSCLSIFYYVTRI